MDQRQESDYINLRNFHNFIKSQLISNSTKRLSKVKNVSLVDISVGRGGDLFKWNKSGISYVLGIDPDEDSIKEAKSRLVKSKGIKTKVDFKVATITDEKFTFKFPRERYFNIVSCQFAIHYFFKNQQMFDSAMMRISNMLKPGGFFIGTTLDGDKINKLLEKEDKVSYNKIYSKVKIPDMDSIKDIDYTILKDKMIKCLEKQDAHYTIEKKYDKYQPFGSQYNFCLLDKDNTGNYFTKVSEEFLVSKDILIQACEHFGLELVQMKNFDEWYKTYSRKGMTDYERSVSFLYFSFVFKKKN
jgi:SAM-dependent methyltransferase